MPCIKWFLCPHCVHYTRHFLAPGWFGRLCLECKPLDPRA